MVSSQGYGHLHPLYRRMTIGTENMPDFNGVISPYTRYNGHLYWFLVMSTGPINLPKISFNFPGYTRLNFWEYIRVTDSIPALLTQNMV